MKNCDFRDVSFVVNARTKSTRIENKILRPFSDDGLCLLEIALNRLASIDGYPCYLAAVDKEIIELYEQKYSDTNIILLKRDKDSVKKGVHPYNVSFKHYGDVSTPYVMPVNACFPFVRAETYIEAAEYFKASDFKTMTSVKSSKNIFYDKLFNMVNGTSGPINTQRKESVYEMAHVFHVFDVKSFMETGEFWDNEPLNPGFYTMDNPVENIDIDEPLDFIMAQQLYNFCGGDISKITL